MLKVLDLRGVAGDLAHRLPRPDLGAEGPAADVRAILQAVHARGDEALRDFTERFDGAVVTHLAIDRDEPFRALDRIDGNLREALTRARDGIEDFHKWRAPAKRRYARDGIEIEHLEIPVARAGVYVPGGLARYPSSVLMTAIPPKVAGVGAVALCTPPNREGRVPDEILAAAALAEVDEVYAVGGAHSIAAMAYGTATIQAVDVIVGAGNRYVSLAKQQLSGLVGIPAAFAGPSEVVVIADETTPVDAAAIDVVVQAEHGPDGLAWLVTWSEVALEAINAEIGRYVSQASRRTEITSTLNSGGYAVLVDSPARAMDVANGIAPEHLEICSADPDTLVGLVRNAGAVFVGPFAPASMGDYVAGPSHVLPTFRSARFSSVLGVEDFLRRVHVIKADQSALAGVAATVACIARAEGLDAHADSVSVASRILHRPDRMLADG